jgi:hypothetical protein
MIQFKIGYIALSMLTLSLFNQSAIASCPDGAEKSCRVNGKHGTSVCTGGRWGPCVKDEPGPISGRVSPKYYILTVVYAPPGTNGGKSLSSVEYKDGSTTGTTVTVKDSFKDSEKTTISAGGGLGEIGPFAQVTESVTTERDTADTTKLDIKKSTTSTIKVVGPSVDGIDHNRDAI